MAAFSVVVATHRRPQFLGRAIASVRSVPHELAQLVVVSDDACADSYAIAAAHLGPDDLFIQRGGHAGPSQSRNVGVRAATGRHVIFLDDDDALSPTFLDEILPHLDDEHVVYTDYIHVLERVEGTLSTVITAERRSLAGQTPDSLLVKNFLPISCAVYPRAIAQGRSFDTTVGYEDWDYLLNAMTSAPLRHIPVVGPVIYARPVADNRGGANEGRLEAIYRAIYKRWPAPNPAGKAARRSFLAAAGVAAELADL